MEFPQQSSALLNAGQIFQCAVVLKMINLCIKSFMQNAYQSVIFSNFSDLGCNISGQKLKEGGLSNSIRSDNGNAGRHVNAEFTVLKDILLTRVVEGNI
jgi:hypothetical protein